MKQFIAIMTTLISLSAQSHYEYNLNQSGVILDGYDVVSYFQGNTPQKGLPKFQATIGTVTYWFANLENKNTFLKEPHKYEPAFGGWCAYAVADSKSKVEVDPKSFVIQDGRLLVFYDGFLSDTRKIWTTTKSKDSSHFLKEADANWPAIKQKAP